MPSSPSTRGTISRVVTSDGIAIYTVTSSSRPKLEWHPAINLLDALVDCDCESFEMRLHPRARRNEIEPSISTLEYHCPHLKKAMLDCIARGEIVIELAVNALNKGGENL